MLIGRDGPAEAYLGLVGLERYRLILSFGLDLSPNRGMASGFYPGSTQILKPKVHGGPKRVVPDPIWPGP